MQYAYMYLLNRHAIGIGVDYHIRYNIVNDTSLVDESRLYDTEELTFS